MSGAWFIARKDVWFMLRRRETLLWTFVMPVVFFALIGSITGGFGGSSQGVRRDALALDAPADAGFLLDQLTYRLEQQDYAVRLPDPTAEGPPATRVLQIPEGFTANVLAGTAQTLSFTRQGEGLSLAFDEIRIQRATYTLLADLLATVGEPGGTTAESLAALNEMPRALTLEVSHAGKRREIPSGFQQSVPGTMVMFTMLVLLTSGAVLLVVERREGLLRRLASTPISRGEVVAGKWGARMILAMIQIGFAMLTGTLLFKVTWGPNVAMVLVVMFVYAGFNASLGLLAGSLARTEGQAAGLGVLGANVMGALGGCWWPIEVTPSWMQKLSVFLPTGLAMDALHKLVSFERPSTSVVPHALVLAAAALLIGWLASRAFRYDG